MQPMMIPFSTALNKKLSGPEVKRSICRSIDCGVLGGLKRRFVTGDCNGFKARSWISRPVGMSEVVKGRISKSIIDRILKDDKLRSKIELGNTRKRQRGRLLGFRDSGRKHTP